MLYLAHNESVTPFMPVPSRPSRTPNLVVVEPRRTFCLERPEGHFLYRVTSGCLALVHYLPDGRRQIYDFLGPQRLFGFHHDAGAQCIGEALTHTVIERISENQAPADLGDEMSGMLRRLQGLTVLLGRKTATEKVASAVLDLAQQFARPMPGKGQRRLAFTVFPTRTDLADWLGLTIETVSRCLNAFKRQGLIDFNRPEQVNILDPAGLRALAAMDPSLGRRRANGN
jgi:CRP/FNR family transcriptional regulator